jgi:hypothetical protein
MRGMDNPTLRKALRLLVHPATLAAMLLLLVNDQLLRRLWPSTLTGKLGDFAWLFFIPFALAVLVALLWPGRGHQTSALVGAVAFGSVAGVFALAKTVPAAHVGINSLAAAILGFEVGWRRDPTDVIALASVAAGAWLWWKTPEPAPRVVPLRSAGWVALAFAALLTVANAPAPEPGVYCLDARDGEMLAYAAYSGYRSVDGGLTWATMPNAQPGACPNPWSGAAGATDTVTDPRDENQLYRYTPGQSIEISTDAGATWQSIYSMAPETEAAEALTRKSTSNAMLRSVPLDGKVDRSTGNAVFAMGHEGVLVRRASDAAWREVAVGSFRPTAVSGADDFLSLLVGEGLLAVALGLLAVSTLATRTLVRGKALWVFALALGWVIWVAVLFVFSPALASGYGTALSYGALLVLGVLLLVTTVISVIGLAQEGRRSVGRALLVGLLAALVFVFPFALWAVNAVPRYLVAAILATVLGVAVIVVGSRFLPAPKQ